MECKYCGAVYDEYKEADCPYCGAPTPKPEEDDTVKVKFKQKTYEFEIPKVVGLVEQDLLLISMHRFSRLSLHASKRLRCYQYIDRKEARKMDLYTQYAIAVAKER